MVKLTQVKARSFGLKSFKLLYFWVFSRVAISEHFYGRLEKLPGLMGPGDPQHLKPLLLVTAVPAVAYSLPRVRSSSPPGAGSPETLYLQRQLPRLLTRFPDFQGRGAAAWVFVKVTK